MGVADNKTYKNMYHFTGKDEPVDKGDLPSLNVDPKINSTIKENPYRSNVEIEKDEIVLQPDLTALFKARGKKHSDGGMDVNLKPESFIFSDDKKLALDERDHKLFELEEGKNFNKTINTPADVLKRNVDIEHYNRMVANIEDAKKDDFAKKSSALMLQKYIQTLGNLAFIQESKKGFPDGLPDFAQNTAPVYDGTLKDEIETQKQYAKYGGTILPKAQWGGIGAMAQFRKRLVEEYPCIEGTPCHEAKKHIFNRPRVLPNVQVTGYRKPPVFQHGLPVQATPAPNIGGLPERPEVQLPPEDNIPQVPEVTGTPERGKNMEWEFSPWQKISQGYNALKYATARRYMPYRSRFNAAYVDPALVNPEQTIGDIQGQTNTQIGALNTLNPILRNAQATGMYGDLLNKVPSVRTQYDNQNVGIKNQFRGANNQIRNQESLTNMQNDQQYYQQSVVGQQNFDNMRNFLEIGRAHV